MSKELQVKWMPPEEVPPVKQGCKGTYWVAVKAGSKEVVFSADYYNVPENEEECQEEAIGWFFEDWDGDINIIPFCETYQLLGWAEYRPPKFLKLESDND